MDSTLTRHRIFTKISMVDKAFSDRSCLSQFEQRLFYAMPCPRCAIIMHLVFGSWIKVLVNQFLFSLNHIHYPLVDFDYSDFCSNRNTKNIFHKFHKMFTARPLHYIKLWRTSDYIPSADVDQGSGERRNAPDASH
jgi:hypothetical protein